jgi:hypothetical protein
VNAPVVVTPAELERCLDLTDCGGMFETLLDQLHEMTSLAGMIARNGREGAPRQLLLDFHELRHALTEDIHSLRGVVESTHEELEKLAEGKPDADRAARLEEDDDPMYGALLDLRNAADAALSTWDNGRVAAADATLEKLCLIAQCHRVCITQLCRSTPAPKVVEAESAEEEDVAHA